MMTWIYTMLLAIAGFQQVGFSKISTLPKLSEGHAEDPSALPVVFDSTIPRNIHEEDEDIQSPRVRFGLRLTPFVKLHQKGLDGQKSLRFIPAEPIRHTLRARMNAINHFFVSDWHIETKPLKWIKQAGRYDIRLNFYRRYGAFGQLEEFIGAVDLGGTLQMQKDNVYVLIGVIRHRLRDKLGHPYFDVVAGFAPPPKQEPVLDLSKVDRSPSKGPATPPLEYNKPLLQNRF